MCKPFSFEKLNTKSAENKFFGVRPKTRAPSLVPLPSKLHVVNNLGVEADFPVNFYLSAHKNVLRLEPAVQEIARHRLDARELASGDDVELVARAHRSVTSARPGPASASNPPEAPNPSYSSTDFALVMRGVAPTSAAPPVTTMPPWTRSTSSHPASPPQRLRSD